MTTGSGRRAARDAARRFAFEALYTASLRREKPAAPEDPTAAELVATVESRYEELVALIDPRLKKGWRFDRLTLSEQLVLLLAAAELLSSEREPTGIVAGWVRLADLYGEPQSHRFVNGVLNSLAAALPEAG